jgi:hypothetical protein
MILNSQSGINPLSLSGKSILYHSKTGTGYGNKKAEQ